MKSLPLILAVAAACGHGPGGAAPDAGNPDAAGPDADLSGTVTVHYSFQSTANDQWLTPANAPVLFYDADGNLVDRAITDAHGLATGHVPAGGSVTIAPPAAPLSDDIWVSWFDVSPGDQLYSAPVYPSPRITHVDVVVPRDGDASAYEVSAPHLYGYQNQPPASGPITVSAHLADVTSSSGDLVATAFHTGAAARFVVAKGAQVAGPTIDLSSSTWSDGVPLAIQVTNVPADVNAMSASYAALDGDQVIWSVDHVIGSGAPAFTIADPSPGAVGDGHAVQFIFHRFNPDHTIWSGYVRTDASTIDLGAMLPPMITSLTQAHDGTLSWSVGPGATPLAAKLYVCGTKSVGVTCWQMIVPGDRRSLTLPALPADVRHPSATSYANGKLVAGDEPGGYAAFVRDPLAFDGNQYGQQLPTAPGTFRMAQE